ncbi:5'-3' DNA helicase ZGRF1 isoform X6 [Homo sapiens]|uniref:5'-3' DNA helicase ZGRF1 isoform X6 n=1 Tax=Homo sapiens TaxID=9606 RepID=UPI0007DC6065|nr:protein ZGRF1 isoform X6 [Homo sapiens]XP_047271868.1 protein ZGRF1 isoform X6 [Homo sapiens]XP_054206396.1 protein ZGRF1 isoform X6 [Homo sapiens]XP_054206397.1 protein ZGRF1 isoform X6 [Homo sapiens]|eukprot:XP_016863859.1 protein ZGRF1 isoform X4 [Homo sapiens]
MESQEFIVLYTHQKMKKSKVWQDGILKITHLGNKAILYDDKGACLESLFLKCLEVKPGDDLESDRYLITVEEVKVAGAIGIVKQNVNKEAPELNSRTFISSGRSLGCQPSGLKRKFTGFQGPRQVPKKMVIMESGESAASHEAKKTGPTIFSPFCSMPPLFPTVGKKDVNNILADPENIVTYKNRERNAMDFSSVFSPSFQINPEVLCEENYFCSPVNSGNKLSDSLLTNEPVKRDSLASHYSGVSQNIRSKAQILALLKSESSSSCEELNSEMTEHFPQKQPQGSLKIATKPKYLIQQEECAEMKSTENLYYQHQSENTMRNKSRWAMYLSSQSSPIHSSTVDGNDTERKPKAQEDDVNSNLKDLSLQKIIQFVETYAEERKKYNVDQSVGNNDPSWNQEVKLEIPSFNESSSLQVTCSSAENDGILSESDIQEDNKIPFNQNDKGCIKGSVLIKENAQEVNTCGTLEKEYEQSESSLPELKHLQIESSNNSRISDDITDMISESKMDNESLNSIHESLSNVTQPFLEVTFNLNNFETSDTEEESQESNKISQDSESWVKDILVNDGNSCFQKRSENTNCEEIEGEHLPFLTSVSDKPTVTFPVKETLPSQFCDKTYVGFDMGICKTENTGKEIEEYSDTLSNFESFKWTDAVYGDNKEDANKPIQEVRINYDFALPPNKSKGINMNLHIPHIQNQIAENSNLFSEDAQPQPFILGSDLDKNDEHVLPSTSSSDNSVQLLNTNQNHYECIALDKSNTHISNSLFYPLGKKHLISKDTEAHISEPEDLGKIRSPPPDHVEVETAREGKQYWNPRNSSELSGLVNTISILKSLCEHSTALDSLEILKKKNTVFQQGTQQTYEPDSPPEVRKPFITVVSPKSPHLHKDSQQFSSSGSKEETAFQAVIPKQIERKTCDPKVTSPEENISTLSPVSTFSLNSRDEDFMVEFSETSLKARTLPDDLHFLNLEGMKKSRSLENENLQRLSLLSRTQVPLITLPRTDGPPDLDSHSYMINSNTYESSGSPMLNLCEKSAVLSFSIEPEDQNETFFSEESREVNPGDVSLNNISTQSKWLKYQNTSQCNVATPNRVDKRITDGFFAEAVSGMHFRDTSERQSDAVNESSLDSVHLQMIKGMLYQQRQDFSSQDSVSRKKVLSLNLKQTSKTEEIKNVLGGSTCYNYSVKDLQEISGSELCFPSGQKIKSAYLPQRQIHIPAVFQSPAHYKQTFTSCLIEHLNILLFGLAQNLQKALSKVDISFYTSLKGEKLKNAENNVPSCHHSQPAKLVMVKKEGPNKGRLFYTCDGPKADRCKFFKWLEDVTPGYSTQEGARPGMVLSDIKSIGLYLRSQKIPLYEECQLLVRKGFDFQRKQYGKLKKFTTVNPEFYNEPKTKLYLKLSRKERSSAYSKNDLWVVSKTLDFELDTFIACSAFFGPSSINEIEILPLKGYFPSNWPTNMVVHALLVCNASTELTTLKNIQDYFNPATLPLTQYLLTTSSPTIVSNKRVSKRKFIPPAFTNVSTKFELLSLGATLKLASELIQVHKLNKDQATALIQIAQMMASHESIEEVKELQTHTFPITIIHGVFGAGKSYLLAVVILFFVQLFEKSEAPTIGNARPWKLLISSSTNVAVDRVLLGLLSLGFENFIRVGSVRKIAKPILPYSLHAGSENESEQLKELHALMKEDLTPTERVYVRKSIEQHKLGTNRTLLKQVRVVGVTCAACPFPCMNDLKFPVVVLDECSQITEPASLLPIARFECEKLILVGDPKQLPPTIQGSDAAHENGLEQTLFDRLCLMGHKPILLRTQYRCHPAISAIANDLFYKGALMNGVTEIERSPLLEWLPTLCFYNVKGLEQIERDNSFHNVAEATFTLKLIQSLIASGIAGSMIGVITLYKSQMYKLCHLLSAVDFHHPDIKTVQVSTVDAFQGAEKEIIILSCVRTRQVGFIDSEKRMNVALTRGKRHLLIVGNLACLRKNQLWGRVIQHCEGREDGLQHANQYEPQLNHLLKDYFEKQVEEKQKKKSEKEKSKDKSHS